MRPRINRAQQISKAEIESCEGAPRRPKSNVSMIAHSRMYTYVFETKVYINRNELHYYKGFHIMFED